MKQKGAALIFVLIFILALLFIARFSLNLLKKPTPTKQAPIINLATPKPSAVDTKNWKLYSARHFTDNFGPLYNFSIKYPPDWIPEEQVDHDKPQIWLNPTDEGGENRQIHIYVQKSNLDNWLNETSTFRTFVKSSEMVVGNLGNIQTAEYVSPVGVGLAYGRVFSIKGMLYEFFITTDGKDPEKHKDIIDTIVSSFYLLN